MSLTNFFHRPQPRRFNITPRFYDESKERLADSEKRVREKLNLQAKQGEEKNSTHDSINGKFKEALEQNRREKNDKVRLGVIIGAIILVIYLVFFYAA